jgi:hypothetical protein
LEEGSKEIMTPGVGVASADKAWAGKTIFAINSTVKQQVKSEIEAGAFFSERAIQDLSKGGKKKKTAGKQFNYIRKNPLKLKTE